MRTQILKLTTQPDNLKAPYTHTYISALPWNKEVAQRWLKLQYVCVCVCVCVYSKMLSATKKTTE